MADKLVEEQLKIVQQIAGLLGETAADTKVAVEKLKIPYFWRVKKRMKRNKHHGLNVEFDGLCMDFGHVSLNKKKEFLCGDCYKIEENDEDHVLVLSDGLGSGVKANILSTLTATMLSTMIINQVELDEAVRAVAKTLPVCSVRNLHMPLLQC